MSHSTEQQAGGEQQQQPGSDGEPTVITTAADAMRRFCTELWNAGELEALQVVRTEATERTAGSVNACESNRV